MFDLPPQDRVPRKTLRKLLISHLEKIARIIPVPPLSKFFNASE